MDVRSVVWDGANREHLAADHPERHISLDEIAEVLADDRRIEIYLEKRDAYQVIGQNDCRPLAGRDLDRPVCRPISHPRA